MTLDLNQGSAIDTGVSIFTSVNSLPWAPGAVQKITDEGNLVRLVNVLGPLDAPTTVKLTNTRIANVYASLARNTIPPSAQAPNVTGQSIFVEVTVMASIGSGADKVYVPLRARLDLALPNHAALTEADIFSAGSASAPSLVGLLIASLTGADGNTRVKSMMRGALYPD